MSYDILIKSGQVIDGSGAEPVVADVGVKNDKITAVGNLENADAKIVINAGDKFVVPGFIDITNHSDTHLTLFKYPNLGSLLTQGVTSIIGGNCGTSLAPLARPDALDAIKKWVSTEEININWANLGEFLSEIGRMRLGVNFGSFVGFGTLLRGVVGNRKGGLTPDDIQKIKFLLEQSMREGAFGLSLGLSYGHERAPSTEEIIEIAHCLKEKNGTVKIHLRSEGRGLIAGINEAIRIGRETGLPIQISHLKAIGRGAWPSMEKALQLISQAKASELDINFDISPYRATGSSLYLLIPPWAREGGLEELFRRIDDKEERARIAEELKCLTLHYDRILVVSAKIRAIVGKTLAELAGISSTSPEETLIAAVRANEGRVLIAGKTISGANVRIGAENENSFISSDGEGYDQNARDTGNLVHPRSFGTFPHFWHRFVNELKTITPAMAVQKISSGPAAKLNIFKRGLIKTGYFADIVVFDGQTIKDRAVYRSPFNYSTGIEWVLVNGQVAVENGRILETRAGKVIKSGNI